MSLGWFKKRIIESTTKNIIKGIVQKVDATLRINPDFTLEEALRIVDKNRGIFFPDEESFTTDLQNLFIMMVWKAYRYERASDRDASSKEHAEIVIGIANDYMSMLISKTKNDYENLTTQR